MIWSRDHLDRYRGLFESVFAQLPAASLHSTTLGVFRLPRSFYSRMRRMMPDDRLLAGPLQESGGLVSYRADLESELVGGVTDLLLDHVPESKFHPCRPVDESRSAITSRQ